MDGKALSGAFVTWEQIARWTIEYTHSKSEIVLQDRGYCEDPSLFSVGKIERLFGLSFDPRPRLQEHLRYLLAPLMRAFAGLSPAKPPREGRLPEVS